ncbi:MAG TPA: hypothetical protein VHJ76_08675 [Actinomycetota bacterium]|nr:hypothetical protein [Actinomycetota bacterium]
MTPRAKLWLVAVVSALAHGAFWLNVGTEKNFPDEIGGAWGVAVLAFVLGGVSVLAFAAARPFGTWSYVAFAAAVIAGGVAVVVTEELLDLDSYGRLMPYGAGLLIAVSLGSYLAWLVARPRVSVVVVVVILAFAGGAQAGAWMSREEDPPAVRVEPDLGELEFPEWKMGDVHVHASGDHGLFRHADCLEPPEVEDLECARRLVQKTAEAAVASKARWVILVEHGAWVSYRGPLFDPECDLDKGTSEWDQLRAAAEEVSPASGVRMLMGEELGTSGSSFDGHFSAYSIPEYVPNCIDAVPDIEYVQGVDDVAGWGAINHPFGGGNKWDCWYPGSRCDGGAVAFAEPSASDVAAFRAIELSNGGKFPDEKTLARWDELLVQGYRIWGVGGSDAHTRSKRPQDVVHGGPGYPNIGKIGASRTHVYVPEDVTPVEGFDATDADDPVRQAIYSGRVVASNGPRALAVIHDVLPGETKTIPAGDVTVLVGIRWPERFSEEHVDPATVRVVYSKIAPDCGDACPLPLVIQRDAVTDANEMTVPIVLKAEWEEVYVRVEVVSGGKKPVGAFVSPIFVNRAADEG